MSMHKLRTSFSKDQNGVSPVVGTILMVAATVAIGATVFTALNGFGSESVEAPTNAAFRAQGLDTDKNGLVDQVKITYVSGPGVLDANVVAVKLQGPSTAVITEVAYLDASPDWTPGDFITYTTDTPGTYYATATVQGNMLLDQSIVIEE